MADNIFDNDKDIASEYKKPISENELHQLSQMISETYDITVELGNKTEVDIPNRTIRYSYTLMSSQPRYKAITHIVSAAASIVHSYPRHYDKNKLVSDFAKPLAQVSAKYSQKDDTYSSEQLSYYKTYLPHKSALAFYERSEHSRAMQNMRREMPGLKHTFLPDPGESFLAPSYEYATQLARDFLKAVPAQPMSMEEFWDGASLMAAMYAEGQLTYEEIDECFQNGSDLKDKLDKWLSSSDANEALENIIDVMDSLAATLVEPEQTTSYPQPSDKPSDGSSQGAPSPSMPPMAGKTPSKSGKEKDDSKSKESKDKSESKEKTEEKQDPKAESCERSEGSCEGQQESSSIREESKSGGKSTPAESSAKGQGVTKHMVEPDYATFSSALEIPTGEGDDSFGAVVHNLAEDIENSFAAKMFKGRSTGRSTSGINAGAPTWQAVKRSASYMISPLVAQIQRRLKDNHESDMDRGFRSGPRIDGRTYIRGNMNGNLNYFKRTSSRGEKRYAAYLLFDISGSMACTNSSIKPFPSVFTRLDQTIAAQQSRIAVAFIESLKRFPELFIGVGAYNGILYPIKPARDKAFIPRVESAIINRLISPGGDNADAEALLMAIKDVCLVPDVSNKLVILFTDGGICSPPLEMHSSWRQGNSKGVVTHMVVTGADGQHPRDFHQFAPAENRDNNVHVVDEANLGAVIGKICQSWMDYK